MTVLTNGGDGTFLLPGVSYRLSGLAQGLVIADLNQDARLDVAVSEASGGVIVLPNLGAGTLGAEVRTAVDADPIALVASDLNGDGRIDLAATHRGQTGIGGSLTLLINDGELSFTAQTSPAPAGMTPAMLAVGDLDRNGNRDLVFGGWSAPGVGVLFDASLASQRLATFPTEQNAFGVAVGDVDRDGDDDVLAATNQLELLRGDGRGALSSPELATGGTPFDLMLVDLDSDGWMDIAMPALATEGVVVVPNACGH